MRTEMTHSSVHAGLAQEMPVVDRSTTSRALVNNPLLRVVEFTFDTGELLTDHASPRAVVVVVVSGQVDFTLDGTTTRLSDGDVVYMAPDARHALEAVTPVRLTLTLVDPGPDR